MGKAIPAKKPPPDPEIDSLSRMARESFFEGLAAALGPHDQPQVPSDMSRTTDPHSVVDALREQAADCLRQAMREKQPEASKSLKDLARSYLKIADTLESRRNRPAAGALSP